MNSAPKALELLPSVTAESVPAAGGSAPRSGFPRLAPLTSYLRSQAAALVATAIDFASVLVLVEWAGLYYVAATAIGAVNGGLMAFVLNRHWSFLAGHGRIRRQLARYLAVWIGSLCLNCALVFVLTDHVGLPYALSKLVTALVVGAGFNFPLHRHYVFR